MSGETNLTQLLAGMQPRLNPGEYVFTSVPSLASIPPEVVIGQFREEEGITLVLEKRQADALGLSYEFIAAWIILTVHSSLEAVGLTAAFAQALAGQQISCNVMAGYYHDHLFVAQADAHKAMKVLEDLGSSRRPEG